MDGNVAAGLPGRLEGGGAGEPLHLRGDRGLAEPIEVRIALDRDAGTGVAWFVTGMPGDRLGGRSAFSAAEEALAQPD